MIVLAALLAGAVTGSLIARKRGGKRGDMIHYGAIYAIGFGLLGLFVTLFLGRVLL